MSSNLAHLYMDPQKPRQTEDREHSEIVRLTISALRMGEDPITFMFKSNPEYMGILKKLREKDKAIDAVGSRIWEWSKMQQPMYDESKGRHVRYAAFERSGTTTMLEFLISLNEGNQGALNFYNETKDMLTGIVKGIPYNGNGK
ncbi:hypothetical protein ACFLZ7_03335 [Nanoarchaeota archaeon]